jgi:hypothetical protein
MNCFFFNFSHKPWGWRHEDGSWGRGLGAETLPAPPRTQRWDKKNLIHFLIGGYHCTLIFSYFYFFIMEFLVWGGVGVGSCSWISEPWGCNGTLQSPTACLYLCMVTLDEVFFLKLFSRALRLRALGWELGRGSWCRDPPSPPYDPTVRRKFFDPYFDWRVPFLPHFFILIFFILESLVWGGLGVGSSSWILNYEVAMAPSIPAQLVLGHGQTNSSVHSFIRLFASF